MIDAPEQVPLHEEEGDDAPLLADIFSHAVNLDDGTHIDLSAHPKQE